MNIIVSIRLDNNADQIAFHYQSVSRSTNHHLRRLNGKHLHYQPSYKLSASALKTRNPNNIDLIVSIDFLKAATSIIFSAEGNVDTRDNTGLIVYLAYTPTTLTYIMD